jgi:hypothetical protein
MTYFRMGNPHYHRRGVVSLSCSGWEGVGPTRYGRQTNCQAYRDVPPFAMFVARCIRFDAGSTNDIFGRSKVCLDCIASRYKQLNVIGSSLTSN